MTVLSKVGTIGLWTWLC